MAADLQTEPRFYEDVYRTELEVWVDALVQDEHFGSCLVISETLCHPHGGGQKGDRATLRLPEPHARALGAAGGLAIADTRKADGRILHVLFEQPRAPGLAQGYTANFIRVEAPVPDAATLRNCIVPVRLVESGASRMAGVLTASP